MKIKYENETLKKLERKIDLLLLILRNAGAEVIWPPANCC